MDDQEQEQQQQQPSTNHVEDIAQRWFDAIKNGTKKAEGRLKKPPPSWIADLHVGDTITWYVKGDELTTLTVRVTDIVPYNTFKEMLEDKGLENVLPGVATIEDGVSVYREWYSEKKEADYGVIAICMEKLP